MSNRPLHEARVLPIAVMAFAIVAFLFVMDYSFGKGKWPWSIRVVEQVENAAGTNTKQAHTACTMDAKLCPDGSAVGRSGPNCEFAPCPTDNTNTVTTNNNTNTVVTTSLRIVLTNKKTGAAITDTAVEIYADNGVRCVTTPCPTNGRAWSGSTNTTGEVTVPAAYVGESMTVTASGYQGAELHVSGKVQSDGSWQLPVSIK